MQPSQPVVVGEAVALDLRTAGVASRGIAAAIDLAIMYVALIPFFIIVGAVAGSADPATAVAILLVVVFGVLIGYPVGLETLWGGRTLGKAAMGLRVVRDDGGPIRFRHALVRGLVGVFLEKPGPLFGAPAVIAMLLTRDEKRLGDLFAGTVVLRDRAPRTTDTQIAMPAPLVGWAAGLDLRGIDDDLAARIRSFVGRAAAMAPGARDTFERSLVAEVISRVGPPPDGTPSWALLAAIVAERRRRGLLSVTPQLVPPPPYSSPSVVAPATQPSLPHQSEQTKSATTQRQSPSDSSRPANGGFAPPG